MKPEYITKLHVKNIGPFDNLNVVFSPDVTVIVGPNGSGKTSILRAITHCFTKDNREYFRYRVGARLCTYFQKGEERAKCGGKVFDLKCDTSLHQRVSPFYEREEAEDGIISYQYTQHPYNVLAIGAHRYFDFVQLEGMKVEENTAAQRESYAKNNPLYIEKPLLPHVKQWMVNRYFIVEKPWGKDLKDNWDKLIEKIPRLSPPGHDLKFERIEEDLNPIFSLDGRECYLEELSSGFKSVLSIVLSIINWIEGVNDGERRKIENACGTVLIDEIEAHLHPAWQKMILKVITGMFPNLQFIVTTHSPYVIASAEKNQVILLPVLNSNMDVKPVENNYAGWRVEYILQDLMGTEVISSPNLTGILESLERAIGAKDQASYNSGMVELKTLVNGKDSIVSVYEMRGAETFESDGKSTKSSRANDIDGK